MQAPTCQQPIAGCKLPDANMPTQPSEQPSSLSRAQAQAQVQAKAPAKLSRIPETLVPLSQAELFCEVAAKNNEAVQGPSSTQLVKYCLSDNYKVFFSTYNGLFSMALLTERA